MLNEATTWLSGLLRVLVHCRCTCGSLCSQAIRHQFVRVQVVEARVRSVARVGGQNMTQETKDFRGADEGARLHVASKEDAAMIEGCLDPVDLLCWP